MLSTTNDDTTTTDSTSTTTTTTSTTPATITITTTITDYDCLFDSPIQFPCQHTVLVFLPLQALSLRSFYCQYRPCNVIAANADMLIYAKKGSKQTQSSLNVTGVCACRH